VGIIPTDAAGQNPEAINLESVREGNPPLARTIRTESPSPETSSKGFRDIPEAIEKSNL
jgi:hypothetical protein